MGIFDKIFRKKTSNNQKIEKNRKNISVSDDSLNIIRPLTDKQKEAIEQSTILLRSAQLYMHYYTDNLISNDINDSVWQNKVLFFWKAEEPFPKKSLPPEFNSYKSKYFLFKENNFNISVQIGEAIPWFGMPGLGEKHVCEMDFQKIAITELYKRDIVEYFEHVELSNENLNILFNKNLYFFLINQSIISFKNNNFYLKERLISISNAYSIGGLQLIKKVALNN